MKVLGFACDVEEEAEYSEKRLSIMDILPVEVITANILTRVPIKPILRCRSVCKPWCSIIDDPRFGKMHLSMMSKTSTSSIILCPFFQNRYLLESDIYIIDDEGGSSKLKSSKMKFPCSDLLNRFTKFSNLVVVGSCSGLLCLSANNFLEGKLQYIMCICNPASTTDEPINLPDITLSFGRRICVSCGFGIDEVNKKFKVVLISCIAWDDHEDEIDIHVYTLGAKSWKKTRYGRDEIPYVFGSSGIFLNGSLHWLGLDDIISFDLGSERIEVIQKPKLDSIQSDPISVGVSEGRLCYTLTSDDCFDIWVQKEYKLKKSWTKEYVIRKSVINEIPHICIKDVIPVAGQINGELILLCDYCWLLVSYNLASGKVTALDLGELPNVDVLLKRQGLKNFGACIYLGSLISPESASNIEG